MKYEFERQAYSSVFVLFLSGFFLVLEFFGFNRPDSFNAFRKMNSI